MQSRRHLVAIVVLVVVCIGAVVYAVGRDPGDLGGRASVDTSVTAPPLRAEGWINSPALTPEALKGKVVLYDFWTYSCVNCVRTIPYLRAWYDRYRADGLVVIGVHSPEFDFEKDHANVRAAVKKLGVDYPVALDDDMAIWDAFGNQYWPAHYTFDRTGHLADTHFGEGAYTETEDTIRSLLGVASSSPRATVGKAMGGAATGADITPETYLGAERGGTSFASPEPLEVGSRIYSAPTSLAQGATALKGLWSVDPEFVQAGTAGASLELHYDAAQVNLVMDTADGKPVDVTVEVDGTVRTTVRVGSADLYALVSGTTVGDHRLRLTAKRAGLQLYAFTFGG